MHHLPTERREDWLANTHRGGNSSLVFQTEPAWTKSHLSVTSWGKEGGRKEGPQLSLLCVLFTLFSCSDEYCDSSWPCPLFHSMCTVALDQGISLFVCFALSRRSTIAVAYWLRNLIFRKWFFISVSGLSIDSHSSFFKLEYRNEWSLPPSLPLHGNECLLLHWGLPSSQHLQPNLSQADHTFANLGYILLKFWDNEFHQLWD